MTLSCFNYSEYNQVGFFLVLGGLSIKLLVAEACSQFKIDVCGKGVCDSPRNRFSRKDELPCVFLEGESSCTAVVKMLFNNLLQTLKIARKILLVLPGCNRIALLSGLGGFRVKTLEAEVDLIARILMYDCKRVGST